MCIVYDFSVFTVSIWKIASAPFVTCSVLFSTLLLLPFSVFNVCCFCFRHSSAIQITIIIGWKIEVWFEAWNWFKCKPRCTTDKTHWEDTFLLFLLIFISSIYFFAQNNNEKYKNMWRQINSFNFDFPSLFLNVNWCFMNRGNKVLIAIFCLYFNVFLSLSLSLFYPGEGSIW